jgi:predicted nuclease of predicted toxin-antitoxin system
VLFVLDNDVAASVGRMLRDEGQRCVHVGQVGLSRALDDQVSVFADDKHGVLLTHDRELIARRRERTFGWHVHLDCNEWDAAELLRKHLPAVLVLIRSRDAIVLRLSPGMDAPHPYENKWTFEGRPSDADEAAKAAELPKRRFWRRRR